MTSKEGTNDPETAVSFEGRIFETTQKGFLSVGIAIGSALGIFDTIARLGEPSTSRDIAYAAGLKERYVREWLGAMVTGNIVEVTDDEKYFLPKHRVATLCQEEGGGALPIFCEGIPMICEVYKDMTECFKENGPAGVPLSKY
ncbi:S-adenosylmethionine-dependent methyltransferase Rv2258c-like, partial [Glandiceps talaboti]